MAAYLNRTISMITGGGGGGGDGDNNDSTGDAVNTSDVTDFTSKTGGGGGPLTPAAGLLSDGGIRLPSANMAGNKSPLQIFVKAKKKINDIYVGIADYVLTTSEFVNGEFEINFVGLSNIHPTIHPFIHSFQLNVFLCSTSQWSQHRW